MKDKEPLGAQVQGLFILYCVQDSGVSSESSRHTRTDPRGRAAYFRALEHADAAAMAGVVDVAEIESALRNIAAKQLLSVIGRHWIRRRQSVLTAYAGTMTSVPEWDRQFRLVRVHHEHRKELGRLRLAGVSADAMPVARQFREALSGLVRGHRPVVDLTADRSLQHGRVDEGGFGMRMAGGIAAGAVFNEDALDALAGDVWQFVLVNECRVSPWRSSLSVRPRERRRTADWREAAHKEYVSWSSILRLAGCGSGGHRRPRYQARPDAPLRLASTGNSAARLNPTATPPSPPTAPSAMTRAPTAAPIALPR